MTKLVCDICGGSLIIESCGIAVCNKCGVEYSPERLKEKFLKEKDDANKGDIRKIENWIKMGMDAADVGNNEEAYKYFTKVVEAEPNNWRAVFEKGKSAASLSTIKKDRTVELSQAVRLALQIIRCSNLSRQELIDIKNEFAVALYDINNEITDLMDEKIWGLFNRYSDKHWRLMWETQRRYKTNIEAMKYAISLIGDYDDELSKYNSLVIRKRICADIYNLCYSIDYWIGHSQDILSYIGLHAYEKQRYLGMYLKLVYEIREIEPDFRIKKTDYPDPFDPGYYPSDEIYEYWEKREAEFQEEKKREVRKKRNDDYWKEHAEEKAKYEERVQVICSELEKLKKTVFGYDEQISEIKKEEKIRFNEDMQLKELKNKFSDLILQKNGLSLLSFKRKRKIQEEIDTLKCQISVCEKNILDDISSRISVVKEKQRQYLSQIITLEKEKKNIDYELTRNR